jgi:RNA polymerase sigma factor (sigma-70 family)
LHKYKALIAKNALQIYINGYDTGDLIQIANIALVNAVHKYDCSKSSPFMAYAKIAIKNSLYDELRKVLNKKNDEKFQFSLNRVNDEGIEFMESLVSDANVEDQILLKEEINILREAINTLSSDERELIDWYYFKQRSLKEYSDIKGVKNNVVIKRKSRIIEKLRKYFLIKTKGRR